MFNLPSHLIGWIILLVSLGGLAIWTVYALRYRGRWRIAVGPISYFLNSALFYIAALAHCVDPLDLNLWSNVVRLHSLFLFIGLAILLLTRRFSWTQHLS